MSGSHSGVFDTLAASLAGVVLEVALFLLFIGIFLLARTLHLIIITFCGIQGIRRCGARLVRYTLVYWHRASDMPCRCQRHGNSRSKSFWA